MSCGLVLFAAGIALSLGGVGIADVGGPLAEDDTADSESGADDVGDVDQDGDDPGDSEIDDETDAADSDANDGIDENGDAEGPDEGDSDDGTSADDGEPETDGHAVETVRASNVESESATLTGELTGLGDDDEAVVYFEWRAEGTDTWTSTARESRDSTGTFSADITGLDSDTEYEFRGVAEADDGIARGEMDTFVTDGADDDRAAVETTNATDVETDSATLVGNLTALGDDDEAVVYFEVRAEGTDAWTSTARESRDSTGTFSADLSGLDNGTTYEFRAVAEGDGGIARGETNTFTTDGPDDNDDVELAVETRNATDIDTESASLEGELTDLSGEDSAMVYFQVRPDGANSWANTTRQSLDSTGTFSADITGLDSDTEYEFRAVAEAGEEIETGGTETFTTESRDDTDDDDDDSDDGNDDGDDGDDDDDGGFIFP